MTKIKMCGLSRPCDIAAANAIRPEYIGFVFYPKSKRNVTPEQAAQLKKRLSPAIQAVGVFVDAAPEAVSALLRQGVIDMAQLHGHEDEAYLASLRQLTDKPLLQAFRIAESDDVTRAMQSSADMVLLDAGMGSGEGFDWTLVRKIDRPYFLAGGLDADNVTAAIRQLRPYAVDVSSGIETDGQKDKEKMAAFAAAVRKEAML